MKQFICLPVLCLLLSCGNSPFSKKKEAVSITGYKLPAPATISPSVLTRLHNDISNYYQTHLVNTGFNGQILVAYKGNIVFEAYNGTVHFRGNDTVNEHTPFHIASTSKTFTAMAVLKLMQEGKLSLSDPFAKIFPEFPYKNVTIKDLLSHRSGLPNYTNFLDKVGWNSDSVLSNQDVMNQVIAHPELVTAPNQRFMYCNTNFALLALLIEKISGVSYPEYIKHNFFEPLGMHDSFVYTPAEKGRITPSYNWFGREEALNYMDEVYGDKNIYSTVRDLFKWDQFLYTHEVFCKATMDSAYTPYSLEKPGKKNYGLGWRMLLLPNGKKPIYHNGWWHGNNSTFYRLVQDSATIIVLNNRFNRNSYHSNKLADLFGNYGLSGEDGQNENEVTRHDSASMLNGDADSKPIRKKTHKTPVKRRHR
jgi:CubicO group peptidase (beta-lactamase class C family)